MRGNAGGIPLEDEPPPATRESESITLQAESKAHPNQNQKPRLHACEHGYDEGAENSQQRNANTFKHKRRLLWKTSSE
jgi:hypothetical protein